MSFNIILYNMTDERNKINKTLSGGKTFPGILRTDCDIMNPVIRVEASADEICGYNYAFIDDFKRWYFVKNVNAYRDDVSVITLAVDVLYTYKNAILNSQCIISRSSRGSDAMFNLPDERLPVKQSAQTHVFTYPELYSNTDPTKAQSLILVLTGINPST